MLRHTLLAVLVASCLAACGKTPQAPAKTDKTAAAATDRPVLITPEDLIAVHSDALVTGPVITGSVTPERRADLRAEISAVVLQVLKENGEPVKRNDLLVRLDDAAIRESLVSAEASSRAAAQSLAQAERQLERLQTLRGSGMATMQQLEDTEIRRNGAQSELVAAKARAAQARQQLQRTEVRAPFDGVVSDRRVSGGDTAQIGKELLKVIDPASMRFEGFVSADKIGSVKVGQPVRFRVNGYSQQEFTGIVKQVDPSANPTTRQVEVLVEFTGNEQPRVAGLYAEGRIDAGSNQTLVIPEAALVRNGDKAYAWRLKDGALQKTDVALGERDARRGNYVVRNGLVDGDKVVRNPGATLKDGQKVEMTASAGAVSNAASNAASHATSATKATAGTEQ